MINRIYVEKKPDFAAEATQVLIDARDLLGIEGLTAVRVLQRYDIHDLDPRFLDQAITTVFSEPPTDLVHHSLPKTDVVFGVQYLPGQFDQRADSATQCLQLLTQGQRPLVHNARIYLLEGDISDSQVESLKRYLINPVDSQEIPVDDEPASPTPPSSAASVPTVDGFRTLNLDEAKNLINDLGLAMDTDDLAFCQEYFTSEGRDPSMTELRVIDTYWSDHCRHTTFLTHLDDVSFSDPRAEEAYRDYLDTRQELGVTKPITLMDLATVAGKYLRTTGLLPGLDESEEINACTVRIDVEGEEWLLLFKNETHNHPTEIEPFGGAATCIGGAIRDPLSGRAYVYQAMRVTGAADPRVPVGDTLAGKLPQRQIVNQAADGYSSYGNQIGLATGHVTEIYHPGYVAKRMEIGAVVGAAPAANVRRETPLPGDAIVLLGGKTGRDGCGGATGSSKTHTASSVEEAGSEVQKGNAPQERKLQRLFRNPEAARLIKRCNDFGAGGVCVAIGELAPGLLINLDTIPKKYEGLTGTELAISESQERMAVVLEPGDVNRFLELSAEENLEATVVAEVTKQPRLVMDFQGKRLVNLSREFLDSNGAAKHAQAHVSVPAAFSFPFNSFDEIVSDLNVASQRGLIERFDSTIGAGTALMPLGGSRQLTPSQVMAAKIPGTTNTDVVSVMSWGFNPFIMEADPFAGGYLAVVESLAKLVASGCTLEDCYLTFQEYFERLRNDAERWGKPLSALLGAYRAQKDFGIAAIGGKDSMSGSFENLDVPPTLVSFAVTVGKASQLVTTEFKSSESRLAILRPERDAAGLPTSASLQAIWQQALEAARAGDIRSAWTPGLGGVLEGLFKMSVGNRIGFCLDGNPEDFLTYDYGAIIVETAPESTVGETIGKTTSDYTLQSQEEEWADALEDVFPTRARAAGEAPKVSYSQRFAGSPAPLTAKPTFLIPVFPGTNCEDDTARAIEAAGGTADIFVVRNLSSKDIIYSIDEFSTRLATSQGLFLPGGFSGGDEPDGSAKLITSFLRNPQIATEVEQLLDGRGGLIGGICNGFQALIKLGLLPYGRIMEPDEKAPTLTHNVIGRHQSRLVRTRVSSVLSPWLANVSLGQVVTVAISHGEGRVVASEDQLRQLADRGQIATQYVDAEGIATMEIDFNPAGSMWAIEGLTSPDGRVFGKMGHSERIGEGLYRNVPGSFDLGMFAAAVKFFS